MPELKPCPLCHAEIDEGAVKCRYCGEWIAEGECEVCGTTLRKEWAAKGICAECSGEAKTAITPGDAQAEGNILPDRRGSAGNVIAALASLFIPGLGQLLQGRFISAILAFGVTMFLWVVLLGWIGHIVAALDAAKYRPRKGWYS